MRETLQQADREREGQREEQREPEERDRDRGQRQRTGEQRRCEEHDEPQNGRAAADTRRPPAHERVQRRVVLVRAIACRERRRRRLNYLARDRFEDEDAEERSERGVLLRLQQSRLHHLVSIRKDIRHGRCDEEEERAGMLADAFEHRAEYERRRASSASAAPSLAPA